MSDFEPDGRDLWRRYRAAMPAEISDELPDSGLVAAYVDGRLDEDAAGPVDAWLARHPDALGLIAPVPAAEPAPLALIRSARALVTPAPRPSGWRQTMAWGSVAASLLLVGTAGFLAGHDAVDHHDSIVTIVGGELIDGPGGGDGDGAVF